MKRVNQGLSLLMSLMLCVTSFNFSLIASANEQDAARIIGFNQLDESIATQTLNVGQSLEDVVLPESIEATVETVEQVEVRKAVEKAAEESEVEPEENVGKTVEDDTDDANANEASDEETEEQVEPVDSEDAVPAESAEPVETEEPAQSEDATAPGAQTEEPVVEEAVPTENAEEATENEETEKTDSPKPVNTGFIKILFPALVAKAAELEEGADSPLAGATQAVVDAIPETEYETVVKTWTVQSEITIENVRWEIADGSSFDTSKEATYIFTPVFDTDYVVDTAVPTIKVNIVNTKKSEAKSVTVTFKVVNGFWDDGTAEDKIVTISVKDGQAIKLSADQIPAVGNKPADSKYITGRWDKTPGVEKPITETTTYTYTYSAKKAAIVVKPPEAKSLYVVSETQ